MFLDSNDVLKKILLDYKFFLEKNSPSSFQSLDFITDIIKLYNLDISYIKSIKFDDNLKSMGLYLYKKKELVFNTSVLEAAYKFNFLSFNSFIIDYFCLILHEINHAFQFRYKYECSDNVSNILRSSDLLKKMSMEKYNYLHDLFPDEIDSNIRASKIVYELDYCKDSMINLINYLKISISLNNQIINSPIDYLYKIILNQSFRIDTNGVNSIFYGLSKSEYLISAICDSYLTHTLCVDIDKERRLNNAIGLHYTR